MENEIVKVKKKLREKYMAARERIPEAEAQAADATIAALVFDSAFYRDAESVFVYISIGREVDTLPMIRRSFADGKAVCVPRTGMSGIMEAVPVSEEEFFGRALTEWPRAYGIPEPPEGFLEPPEGFPPADPEGRLSPDLVIAPSLALDRFGFRLGYGGGFYDGYIKASKAQKSPPLVAAVQRSFFVLDDPLPREPYDMAVDVIVTENGIVIPSSSARPD